MKLSIFAIGFATILVALASLGGLMGINDPNFSGNLSDNSRNLLGGENANAIKAKAVIDNYNDATQIETQSGEEGTLQQFKAGTKVDSKTSVSLEQAESVGRTFGNVLGSPLILTLVSIIIGGWLVWKGIGAVLGRDL